MQTVGEQIGAIFQDVAAVQFAAAGFDRPETRLLFRMQQTLDHVRTGNDQFPHRQISVALFALPRRAPRTFGGRGRARLLRWWMRRVRFVVAVGCIHGRGRMEMFEMHLQNHKINWRQNQ